MTGDDLAEQLHQLQNLRSLGVLGDDAYDAALTTLRTRHGDVVVDALLHQARLGQPKRSHTQVITGAADIAIAGDVQGNVYLYGQRGKTAAELLAGYLRRVVQRCGTLPLQGVREQKTANDVLRIGLDQVYTQLATTVLVKRETFAGPALRQFDPETFWRQHVGGRLLPSQQRLELRRPLTPDDQRQRREQVQGMLGPDFKLEHALSDGEITQGLDTLDIDILDSLASRLDWLTFLGPQLVSEAIVANPRLVLLGEPGSGKSTALRYLALTLAAAGLDESINLAEQLAGWSNLGTHGRLLPLFVPLLPLAKRLAGQKGHTASADDLWNYLAEHLEANGRYEGLAAAVHAELEAGRVLLLLDGLDEVAGADSRRQVVTALGAFADQYADCRIIISCRVRAYEGEQNAVWRLPDWPTATLADWTLGQMEHFVAAWYAAAASASEMPPAMCEERIQALQHAIRARPDLQRLGVRPLLLTIMALVHLNDGRLPEDRVTLYSRCVDILLAQWEVRGKDETVYGTLMEYVGLPDADVRSLRALLEEAAFLAHEASAPDSPGRLGRANLRELVGDELRRRGHRDPWDGTERFLEYADLRAGLLQASDAGDAYAFPHLTFQEYLAGLKLVSGVGVVDRIMARRRDDRWRVPMMLGIADHVSSNKLEMPYLLLGRLLLQRGKSAEDAQRDILLAAEIGDDLGWDRLERGDAAFEDVRRDLTHALSIVVEGSVLPAAERIRAGVFLGMLGDPRPGVCNLPPRMAPITGGSFGMGSTTEEAGQIVQTHVRYYQEQGDLWAANQAQAWLQDEVNALSVSLPTFEIGRYPVTNAQYALFIDEGGYEPDRPWWAIARKPGSNERVFEQRRRFKDRPEYWYDERFGEVRPNHPVVGVSWYEACAFAVWLTQHPTYNSEGYTYQLPSEAEWEYAARGNGRRRYAWGAGAIDGERANFGRAYAGTTAVGCFMPGATPDRVFDLTGNVWEWTRNVYAPYPYDSSDGREAPDNPAKERFSIRGGSWLEPWIYLAASYRVRRGPSFCDIGVGFRLVRFASV